MVNPNNPNSDPDGVPPSDPSPDSSSGDQPPEEGSISDELFDSLSELLGDTSDSDEPVSLPGSELLGETSGTEEEEQVSLPDLGLWAEEPPTPEQPIIPTSSSEENIAEGIEEPTVLQMGPEETTPPAEDLSAIDDILSAGTPSDGDPIDIPLAAEEETFVSLPDPWGEAIEEPILPSDIESSDIDSEVSQSEPTETSFSDIEAIASPESAESTPDPDSDSIVGGLTPSDLGTTEIEEFTVLQTPDFADPSDPAPDPIPPIPMGTESSPLDPNADVEPIIPLEVAATGSDSPSPEGVDFSDPDIGRPSDTEIPGVDLTPAVEDSEAEVVAEDTPSVFGVPPLEPLTEPPTAAETPSETSEEPLIPTSFEDSSTDTDESTPEESVPIVPPQPENAAAAAAFSGAGGLSSSDSDRDREPVAAVPASDAALVGAGAVRSSTGGLGALSNKLPLNRHQAVGLLVALSTLGSITYFGVTDNSQNSSGPALAPPAVTEPDDAAPIAKQPIEDQPSDVAKLPAVDEGAAPAKPRREEVTPEQPTSVPPVVPVPKAKAPAPTPKATPSKLDISDVPPEHWAHPFVTKLHAEGIIPDYPDGKFQPDKPVTRAELAAQIQRAFVNEPGQRTLTFSDLTPDYWAMGAIEGAVDKKFMSGYSEGDFRPDKLVPRYEVLVALASGLELNIPSEPEASLQRFPDQDQLPDWSKGKIAATTQDQIVVSHPDPGQLNPEANATRAEVAAMIYQSLVKAGRLEPVESEYVVPLEP